MSWTSSSNRQQAEDERMRWGRVRDAAVTLDRHIRYSATAGSGVGVAHLAANRTVHVTCMETSTNRSTCRRSALLRQPRWQRSIKARAAATSHSLSVSVSLRHGDYVYSHLVGASRQ